jgi:hypothetical protein
VRALCGDAADVTCVVSVGRYVHGTRVVCPVLQPSGFSRVEVLDMNVHALRTPTAAEKLAGSRLGIDVEKPPVGSRLVTEPSVFPAGGVFAKEVVTELPYYAVPAPGQDEGYVGYMIDEQRLLGLKVRVPRVDMGLDTCGTTRRARLRTATWGMWMCTRCEGCVKGGDDVKRVVLYLRKRLARSRVLNFSSRDSCWPRCCPFPQQHEADIVSHLLPPLLSSPRRVLSSRVLGPHLKFIRDNDDDPGDTLLYSHDTL